MRKILQATIQIVVSAGLIAFLFTQVDISDIWSQVRTLPIGALVGLSALLWAVNGVMALRWKAMIQALGATLDGLVALRAVLLGLFFNQALPSTFGGDIVRLWYGHRGGVRFATTVSSVLLDRISALFVLSVMSFLSAPVLLSVASSKTIGLASGAIGVAGLVSVAVLYAASALPGRLSDWSTRFGVAALSSGAWTIARQPRTLVLVLVLSTLMHGTIVFISLVFGTLLDLPVQAWVYLVLVPPMILVSMLPVAVAGWGVREGAFVAGFSAFGVPAEQALALSVAVGVAHLVAGVFSGASWLLLGLMPNRYPRRSENLDVGE